MNSLAVYQFIPLFRRYLQRYVYIYTYIYICIPAGFSGFLNHRHLPRNGKKHKTNDPGWLFSDRALFLCFSTDSRYLIPGSSWYAKQMISYLLEGKGLFCRILERSFGVAGQNPTNHQLTEAFFDFETLRSLWRCALLAQLEWGAFGVP